MKHFLAFFIFIFYSTICTAENMEFSKGKENYYKLNIEKALEHFQKAKEALKEGEELYDTHLFMALCFLSQKNEPKAKESIKDAWILNSQKTPNPTLFSPEFISFFKKNIPTNHSKGTLEISSKPPFSKVFMNGFEAGETPLITDLPHGKYLIRLAHENHSDWETHIQFNKPSLRIDASLTFLPKPLDSRRNDSPTSSSLSPQTQKFLQAIEENSNITEQHRSVWFWSIAAVAVGGITYGIWHSQTHPSASPTISTYIP